MFALQTRVRKVNNAYFFGIRGRGEASKDLGIPCGVMVMKTIVNKTRRSDEGKFLVGTLRGANVQEQKSLSKPTWRMRM